MLQNVLKLENFELYHLYVSNVLPKQYEISNRELSNVNNDPFDLI